MVLILCNIEGRDAPGDEMESIQPTAGNDSDSWPRDEAVTRALGLGLTSPGDVRRAQQVCAKSGHGSRSAAGEVEFARILKKLGIGYCISLNPGLPIGIDFDALLRPFEEPQ
jgi:hypothetical protein